jgi:hypothetical protein
MLLFLGRLVICCPHVYYAPYYLIRKGVGIYTYPYGVPVLDYGGINTTLYTTCTYETIFTFNKCHTHNVSHDYTGWKLLLSCTPFLNRCVLYVNKKKSSTMKTIYVNVIGIHNRTQGIRFHFFIFCWAWCNIHIHTFRKERCISARIHIYVFNITSTHITYK